MRSRTFLDLPLELLDEGVLRRLDFRDVLRCSATCRYLLEVVRALPALQLKVELGSDGIIDDSISPYDTSMSSFERLHRHLDLRRRWRTLRWHTSDYMQLPPAWQWEFFEQKGNTFVQCDSELYPDLDKPHSSHTVFRLTPETSMIRSSVWPNSGVWSADHALDCHHDLIAFLERHPDADEDVATISNPEGILRIYLHSLSSNLAHPKARTKVLYCCCPMGAVQFSSVCRFEIFDDMLSICLKSDRSVYLAIWNWQSGNLVVDHTFEDNDGYPSIAFRTYAFLTSRIILAVSDATSGALDIYTLSDGSSPRKEEKRAAGSIAGLTHRARLQLPPMKEEWRYRDLGVAASHFNPTTPPALLLVTLTCVGDLGHAAFRLVVSIRNILRYASDSLCSSSHKPPFIPWERWGPASSRLFSELPTEIDEPLEHWWPNFVVGNRMVMNLCTASGPRNPRNPPFEIVEFGYQLLRDPQFALTRNTCQWGQADFKKGLPPTPLRYQSMMEPLRLAVTDHGPFAIAVETGLPYHSVQVEIFPCSGSRPEFGIDDRHLYFLHDGPDEDSPTAMRVCSF